MKMRWLIAAGVALSVLAAASFYGVGMADQAGVAAAAIAKVRCSCVFVAARTPESCRADDPPGFEQIATEIDTAGKVVTARVMGLITRRAIYSDSYGCVLEP
jgi:hypothetical protein